MLGAFLLAAAAASGHINPAQSIESAYSAKAEMRFHTLNYSAMVCTDPQYAVRANLISSGMGATTDPQYDAQWLETQKANKNCFQLAPTFGFKTTNAFAVYAGEIGAFWVVGVKDHGGNIVGYIPIDDIQFIPIPYG